MAKLILGPRDKPQSKAKWALFSIQQVFAMFGATVLVPILIGFDTSVALFTAGIGTLIYIAATQAKVPIFLGSSFAFLPLGFAMPGSYALGVVIWGAIYLLIAGVVKLVGTGWLRKALPPVIIGPTIIVIGLGLAPVAIDMVGLGPSTDHYMNPKSLTVAMVTFFTAIGVLTLGKGMIKIMPVLIAIVVGYLFALALGVVDTQTMGNSFKSLSAIEKFFSAPDFKFIWKDTANFGDTLLFVIPLAIVTIAEHIGDHKIISEICDEDFLVDPGLHRTLLGDGAATVVSGFFGGPVNTTYGENTSTVQLSGIGSVYVTGLAAIFALVLSFVPGMSILLASIPQEVMGGISLVLFGMIAFNGVKVLVSEGERIMTETNMIIIASMLVFGLGGGVLAFSIGKASFNFGGTALTIIIGLTLNLLLNYLVPWIKSKAYNEGPFGE